jgi:hypothetical protein
MDAVKTEKDGRGVFRSRCIYFDEEKKHGQKIV